MQTIDTAQKALSWLSRYAGGSIPPVSEPQYKEWVSWISEGQEDAAERGFWSKLLTPYEIDITAGEETVYLPEDYHKRNGIYLFDVNGIDWNEPFNKAGQRLFVRKTDDGSWILHFLGFTPTENSTAKLWYFRHPGIITDENQVLMLDGKMCAFYALTEYSRQSGELGSLDDARAEYNNRFEESLANDMLPSPQELLSWNTYHPMSYGYEKSLYSRNRNR